MADRREVDVNRPEHSWIPFYRELAGKLVEDGWRDRQGELVRLFKGILGRLRSEGVLTPRVEMFLNRYIDPFTIFAVIGRNLTPANYAKTVRAYKTAFQLKSRLPEKPEIPWVDNRRVGFFGSQSDLQKESVKLWDAFELVYGMDPSADSDKRSNLIELIDRCVEIDEVALPKLTGGFYWINPSDFLRSDTVDGVGGQSLGIKAVDGESYLKCLLRTHELTSQPFPEVNIAVWEGREIKLDPSTDVAGGPNVWIVRGGSSGAPVDNQLENGIAGVGFSLEDIDLSRLPDGESVRQAYADRNPGSSSGSVAINSSSVANFLFDLAIADYVLMPAGDFVHYGTVLSNPYYVSKGPWRNRRDVRWIDKVPTSDLPSLPGRTRTVVKATDRLKDEFIALIEVPDHGFTMPEDSWVPFHLEMGRKLVEGEWWLEEKREELENRIDAIRWADPEDVGDDYQYDRWTGDPFSFYLSFNMRSMGSKRVPGYAKVKELFDLDSELPDVAHEAAGYGVHGEFGKRLSSAEIESFWEFYRLVQENDPLDDADVSSKFVDHFDNIVVPDRFVGLRNRKLSYWLYWVDPRRFIYIEQLAKLGILDELGLPADCGDGTGYLKALAAARELAVTNGLNLVSLGRWGKTREELGIEPTLDGGVDLPPYGVTDMLEDGLFFEPDELQRIIDRFEDKKNLILQGPPGVGKTFVSKRLAYALMGERADGRIRNVQFHQSYSYEEFVQGYRPGTNDDDQLIFELRDGTFLELCKNARDNPDDRFVMVIDEINRGNLSRVFGELLSLIEKDKRGDGFTVRLAGGNEFSVPENVYILGTMNLADRSLAGMDYAMRRRFAFVTLEPQFGSSVFGDWLREKGVPAEMITRINDRMSALNEVIAGDASLGRNFAVGHSYFCDIPSQVEDWQDSDWDGWYREIVKTEIQPLLEEYWFDDPKKAGTQVKENLLDGIPENG